MYVSESVWRICYWRFMTIWCHCSAKILPVLSSLSWNTHYPKIEIVYVFVLGPVPCSMEALKMIDVKTFEVLKLYGTNLHNVTTGRQAMNVTGLLFQTFTKNSKQSEQTERPPQSRVGPWAKTITTTLDLSCISIDLMLLLNQWQHDVETLKMVIITST